MPATAPTRSARILRAGAASGLAVLVALGAHLAGGAAAPSPLLVAAVLAAAWPAGCLLIGARPRLWRQAAVIGLAQLLLHAVFELGGAVVAQPAAMSGMAGMHGATLATPTPTAMPAGHHSPAMLLGHGLAWLLTTAAWRWGEAAVAALLAPLAVHRLLALLRPLAAPLAATPTFPEAAPRRPVAVVLAAAPRRGPPATA